MAIPSTERSVYVPAVAKPSRRSQQQFDAVLGRQPNRSYLEAAILMTIWHISVRDRFV